jgi:HrpA-like RNA helicase
MQDVLNFDFLDAPPRAAILRSLELLYALGALDSQVCGASCSHCGLWVAQHSTAQHSTAQYSTVQCSTA